VIKTDDYKRGYDQALKDINIPVKPMQEDWCPSECPRCQKSFHDYEPVNDGYYKRAYGMERCPYCGQKLEW